MVYGFPARDANVSGLLLAITASDFKSALVATSPTSVLDT